jgi:hypothetical protein
VKTSGPDRPALGASATDALADGSVLAVDGASGEPVARPTTASAVSTAAVGRRMEVTCRITATHLARDHALDAALRSTLL